MKEVPEAQGVQELIKTTLPGNELERTDFHPCEDGGTGVADIIGYRVSEKA